METKFKRNLLAVLIAGILLPMAAQASEADLLKKIEALALQNEMLAQQLQALKGQVQTNEAKATPAASPVVADAAIDELKSKVKSLEDKSLGKWLTVGGDYHFRYDMLEGQSKMFTDVSATFANAQTSLQTAMLTDTTGAAAANLAGMAQFSSAMGAIKTYDEAVAFGPQVNGMMPALGAYAVTVPAYKPKNNSLMTNRFGLDLNAKATQDVSVTTHLQMYKVFGSQSDGAVTNSGSAPFF